MNTCNQKVKLKMHLAIARVKMSIGFIDIA